LKERFSLVDQTTNYQFFQKSEAQKLSILSPSLPLNLFFFLEKQKEKTKAELVQADHRHQSKPPSPPKQTKQNPTSTYMFESHVCDQTSIQIKGERKGPLLHEQLSQSATIFNLVTGHLNA
jgi:hypothetical protein